MNGINKVELLGNITDAPKVGKTKTGKSFAQFTVAVNEDYKDKAGNLVKSSTFLNVSAFGAQADVIGKFLVKGSRVLVNGKIRTSVYEAKDGTKRTSWDIIADMGGVMFLDRREKSADDSLPDMPPVEETSAA